MLVNMGENCFYFSLIYFIHKMFFYGTLKHPTLILAKIPPPPKKKMK